MMEEKHVLPHDRLMLEEDQWDDLCGDSAWLAEGRGGGVPGVAASLCPLLAVLEWDARPLVSTSCLSASSETSYLANSSICLKDLLQIFFSLIALF